jgi:hypothetical protein
MHARASSRLHPAVITLCLVLAVCVCGLPPLRAQRGFDGDRVMMQGFYRECYRHRRPSYKGYGPRKWYTIVGDSADARRDAHFGLIWRVRRDAIRCLLQRKSAGWKQCAVPFLENHDTGYRMNADGAPQDNHKSDSFQNNWEVDQACAYILTHPACPP